MAKGIRLQIILDDMVIVDQDSLALNLISRWGYGGKMNLLGDVLLSPETKMQIVITPVETTEIEDDDSDGM